MSFRQVQMVAVCDCFRDRRDRAKAAADKRYGDKGCTAYADFRELLARDDIEAVSIATPEHWHALHIIEAAGHGKDIFCEKPLTLTLGEARAAVDAVRRYGRVMQTGTQQRSDGRFRFAYWLQRPLKWDPEKERFINDAEANRMLDRPKRAPWRL